jgi:hypothetical protein
MVTFGSLACSQMSTGTDEDKEAVPQGLLYSKCFLTLMKYKCSYSKFASLTGTNGLTIHQS